MRTAATKYTMRHRVRGSLVIFVNLDRTPSVSEWNHHFDDLEASANAHGHVRILVAPGTGAPTPVQRQRIVELYKRHRVRAATLSDNLVVRGVMTVLSWFNVQVCCFDQSRADEAFRFLEMTPDEVSWARDALPAMRRELGG